MKIEVSIPTMLDIRAVRIEAAVNYGEEEIPNDFPCRTGDVWKAEVDMDTGKIKDWPAGRGAKMHLTVKDCGTYELVDASGKVVALREQNYVPHGVVPGQYGDTIEIEIWADGIITNWPRHPDVEEFFPED